MAAMARLNKIWRCNTTSFASSVFTSLLLPPFSSNLWLWNTREKDPDLWNQVPEETSHLLLGAQDQGLGAEQIQLPFGSTGTSSGYCQETESCMLRACHTLQQPLQNHPSGHPGVWVTPCRQRKCYMDNVKEWTSPAHARTARRASAEKTGRGSLRNRPSRPPDDPTGQGTELNWTELKHYRLTVHTLNGWKRLKQAFSSLPFKNNVHVTSHETNKFTDIGLFS